MIDMTPFIAANLIMNSGGSGGGEPLAWREIVSCFFAAAVIFVGFSALLWGFLDAFLPYGDRSACAEWPKNYGAMIAFEYPIGCWIGRLASRPWVPIGESKFYIPTPHNWIGQSVDGKFHGPIVVFGTGTVNVTYLRSSSLPRRSHRQERGERPGRPQ